jgi:hypothetical protein
MKGTCEICKREKPNCGPFRDGNRVWSCVCGSCKVRRTLADPERRAKLERDVRAAVNAALKQNKGEE